MALITVRAPEPVTEVVCGVPFTEGVAKVDPKVDAHRRALLYFTQAGYGIDDSGEPGPDQAAAEPVDGSVVLEPPPDAPGRNGSKVDWVAFATTAAPNGLRLTEEQAEALTRDQLAEKYLGPKED